MQVTEESCCRVASLILLGASTHKRPQNAFINTQISDLNLLYISKVLHYCCIDRLGQKSLRSLCDSMKLTSALQLEFDVQLLRLGAIVSGLAADVTII